MVGPTNIHLSFIQSKAFNKHFFIGFHLGLGTMRGIPFLKYTQVMKRQGKR